MCKVANERTYGWRSMKFFCEKRIRSDVLRSRTFTTVLLCCLCSAHLNCTLRVRLSRSAWPDEYCSMTSFTSYGLSASRNRLRARKYLSCVECSQQWQTDNIALNCDARRSAGMRPKIALDSTGTLAVYTLNQNTT